jgi:hypothetical protein
MPFVMISVSRRAGAIKDTLRNAGETGEMVLNMSMRTGAADECHIGRLTLRR